MRRCGLLLALLALAAFAEAQPKMPNWHLAFTEDWNYANAAALEAAYTPDQYGDPFSAAVDLTPGATEGPGGVQGIKAELDHGGHTKPGTGDPVYGSVDIGGVGAGREIVLVGNEFRITGTFDNAHDYADIILWYTDSPGGIFTNELLNVAAGKEISGSNYGDMTVLVRTDLAHGTGGTHFYQQNIVGGFPRNTISALDIQLKMSRGSDGYVRVYRDAALVFSFDGPVYDEGEPAAPLSFNQLDLWPSGRFANLRIYDTAAAAVAVIAPIPIATTFAPTTPCDPQTQVGNGGRGKSGCSMGGVRWGGV